MKCTSGNNPSNEGHRYNAKNRLATTAKRTILMKAIPYIFMNSHVGAHQDGPEVRAKAPVYPTYCFSYFCGKHKLRTSYQVLGCRNEIGEE